MKFGRRDQMVKARIIVEPVKAINCECFIVSLGGTRTARWEHFIGFEANLVFVKDHLRISLVRSYCGKRFKSR